MTPPRRFLLRRTEDVSGTSGVGVVAYGVEFGDGVAVIRWNGDLTSTAVYTSVDTLVAIHGHGGKTVVEWIDGPDRPSAILDTYPPRGWQP